jgi:hypothetical protein
MIEDREERIREKAHKIWEEQGRPEGQAEAHWDMASELVAIEDSQMATTTPVEISKHRTNAPEPILAVENAGEFPTLTDQGEQEIPHRRGKEAARSKTG